MKQQQPTQNSQEVRMEQQREYTVTINGQTRTVTVEGDTFLLDNGSYTEVHSVQSLVNKARRNSLPEWVRQIPGLIQKIEGVFQGERERGLDPLTRFANSDGKLTVTDLKSGTSLSAPIADLKRRLAQTGTLPTAFNSARAKELLRLAA